MDRPTLRRPTLNHKTSTEAELVRLRQTNSDQAIAIQGLQKSIGIVREEMKALKAAHAKALEHWRKQG